MARGEPLAGGPGSAGPASTHIRNSGDERACMHGPESNAPIGDPTLTVKSELHLVSADRKVGTHALTSGDARGGQGRESGLYALSRGFHNDPA